MSPTCLDLLPTQQTKLTPLPSSLHPKTFQTITWMYPHLANHMHSHFPPPKNLPPWMYSPLDINQSFNQSFLTWMYSPLDIRRFWMPSHLRKAVNTTVRAGIFKPMANVSVANSTYEKMYVHCYARPWTRLCVQAHSSPWQTSPSQTAPMKTSLCSQLRKAVNTTERAGIFKPMANVSVANSTYEKETCTGLTLALTHARTHTHTHAHTCFSSRHTKFQACSKCLSGKQRPW